LQLESKAVKHKRRRIAMAFRRVLCAASIAVAVFAGPLCAGDRTTIGDEEFETLHQMLKPQPGESRWMEIDWYPSVWEARQRAAAEGKPIFLMAGSGGAPAAGC
jgi:hypothetical protein